ncbi:unnamed protein product [Protopolystoma xenopodis]|uniref:Charged multivesicular body protein 6 n=1 Tax=Protopolystoma xenopodis TaxID=117903 RepID=A0A3S5AM39_9PLAT|nr:unnamed protein product [Protopolystoma xenopodis]
MGIFFSKRSRITQQDKAILQLKQQRDKLKQYKRRVEVQIERDRSSAKQLLSDGKKDKALLLLKKKIYQESLIEKSEGYLRNIERLTEDLEFAQVEIQVFDGLKAGNAALKSLHEALSLDDVEKLMSDTQDAIDYQREIDSILSGCLTSKDLSAAECELNELLSHDDLQQPLPEVPGDALPATKRHGTVDDLQILFFLNEFFISYDHFLF